MAKHKLQSSVTGGGLTLGGTPFLVEGEGSMLRLTLDGNESEVYAFDLDPETLVSFAIVSSRSVVVEGLLPQPLALQPDAPLIWNEKSYHKFAFEKASSLGLTNNSPKSALVQVVALHSKKEEENA